MVSGLAVFLGVLVLCLYTLVVARIAYCCGETSGREESDREIVRRVLISDRLDAEVRVEILSICNDRIYWKYYEEVTE
jgi:hypothetical protein